MDIPFSALNPDDKGNVNLSQGNDNNNRNLDQELEDTVDSFQHIQAELNHQHAHDALRELIARLDLTPRERVGLEADLYGLEYMLTKLERLTIQIVVFGMVGRGKSSLLNALLGQQVFATGPTHGVTQTIQQANWSFQREPWGNGQQEVLKISLPGVGESQVELIDTPGIDEVDGQTRELLAKQLARRADLILFVIAGDMTQVEYDALVELRQANKPILLVFNKVDQYSEADRLAIYQKIREERVRGLLSSDEIVMAAASPLVAQARRRSDGQLVAHLSQGEPWINELKLRILEILHHDGKSLVALNSLLYADDVNERVVQRKLEIRDRAANQVIWNGAITKSVAIALNPVTIIDMVGGALIDLALILTLSKLYGISMTQQGALGLLQKIAIGMGGITIGELVANLGLSSLKTLLGISTTATGGLALAPYVSVALMQAGAAAVSTYAIGQIAKVYLANGASWGADGPKAVIQQILESLDEASILQRVRDELQAKLERQRQRVEI